MITQGFTEDTIVTRGLSESLLEKLLRVFRRAVYMTGGMVKVIHNKASAALNMRSK